MTPEQLAQARLASQSILGRTQGAEQFDARTIDMSAAGTVQYRPFALNRPLESIVLELRCRIAVSAANITAVGVEAIQNLIQRVKIEGNHIRHGTVSLVNASGASLFAAAQMFGDAVGNQVIINGTAASRLGVPFATSFLGTTAGSPYDVILLLNVPLGPWGLGVGGPARRWAQSFLAMPGDWNDTLSLTVDYGDKTALGNTTGATIAFSGYGGTGNPSLRVHLCYSILGDLAAAGAPMGIVLRNERQLTQFTALASGTRLASLEKRVTNHVIVKSGLLQTTLQSAGITTFASLSSLMLDKTQLVVDLNKPVRNITSDLAERARVNRMFDVAPIDGYHALTFLDGQNPLLAYRGDGLQGGSSFDLMADVISANAANRIHVLTEQVIGGPYPPLR